MVSVTPTFIVYLFNTLISSLFSVCFPLNSGMVERFVDLLTHFSDHFTSDQSMKESVLQVQTKINCFY